MKHIVTAIAALLLFVGCQRIKQTAKEMVHKTGEVVGKGTSEFVEGMSSGVHENIAPQLKLGDALQRAGLSLGKSFVSDSAAGRDNVLTVYMKFDKDFDGTLLATVYDENDVEYGRSSAPVRAKSGNAVYVDFLFDKRTRIETRSHIYFERPVQ